MTKYVDKELVKKDHQRWLGYIDQDMINRMNITIDNIHPADVIERSNIDEIRAEIERQEKWLSQAGYSVYNVDIAFSAIKRVIEESAE